MPSGRASVFDGLSTHFGPLSPPHRRRLRRLLVNPTRESGDDAYCLILRSEPGLRLVPWQCVRAVDPEFPPKKGARPRRLGARTRPAHPRAGAALGA